MSRIRSGSMINCLICSKSFYVLPCDLKTTKYCSRICRAIVDTKKICVRGHNISVVGRTKRGICRECKKIAKIEFNTAIKNGYVPEAVVQFCPKGHDTFVTGRYPNRICKQCILDYQVIYRIEHPNEIKEKNKQWRHAHREEVAIKELEWNRKNKEILKIKKKIYRDNHPEIYRPMLLRNTTNRGLRVVSWGQEGMKQFYRNMPKDMSEDHIIPLQGKLVSGLHVIWNLQYLSPEANSKKGNKINLIEATKFYENILIEARLK